MEEAKSEKQFSKLLGLSGSIEKVFVADWINEERICYV
jgi:hypothetical protein